MGIRSSVRTGVSPAMTACVSQEDVMKSRDARCMSLFMASEWQESLRDCRPVSPPHALRS